MFSLKAIKSFLFLILILLLTIIKIGKSGCVMYGQCNQNSEGLIQNCLNENYSDPAPLNKTWSNYQDAVSVLRRYCPEFYEEDDPELCCDNNQVITMGEGISLSEVFSRCPTCMKNLLGSICGLSCSPNQSNFISVVKYSNETGNIGITNYITEINVTISEYYMNKTYNSCVGVALPSSGGVVMDSTCGEWGSTYCNAQRWFNYMGVENPYTPFTIHYIATTRNDSSVLNPKSIDCNEKFNNATLSCSCVDCRQSCINGYFPELTGNFLIAGQFGPTFIVSLCLLLSSCIFTFILINKKKIFLRTLKSQKIEIKCIPCSYIGSTCENYVENVFYHVGMYVGNHSASVLFIWTWIVVILSYGSSYLTLTTNTIELWASPTSQSRLEKNYFDTYFGPFYRTEQVYVKTVGIDNVQYNSTSDGTISIGPIFNKTFLLAVFALQKEIENITLLDGSGLEKICYAPIVNAFSPSITVKDCTIQSILGYFDNDITTFNSSSDYIGTLIKCFQSPYSVDCLAPYGGPVLPGLAVGGNEDQNYLDSSGLSITFLVSNSLNRTTLEPAMKWEEKFIGFLKNWDENYKPAFMSIAYSSERSIEDEISRLSFSEISTVVFSYLIMFVYIVIALGRLQSWKTILVDCKITLGIGGIVLVLVSIVCALGTGGYFNTTITLLTIEVLPFITLAVGVDNIFIITQTYQESLRNNDLTHQQHLAKTLSSVGPSILMTSISEIVCFCLGILSDMPAVRTFAIFATLSLIYGFLLQLTAFIALLQLDGGRYKANKMDLLCCIRIKKENDNYRKTWLEFVWSEIFTPFVMRYDVRCISVFLFFTFFAINLMMAPSVQLGLDQQLSMPDDSHVIKYFQYMYDLLGIGSPVYWITRGKLNYSSLDVQNKFCGGTGCLFYSTATQLYTASQQQNITYISTQVSSWLDDYKDWSELASCCKHFKSNNSFCPHTYSSNLCSSCSLSTLNITWEEYFPRYLSFFLQDNPDTTCAKGGHAAYANSVDYFLDDDGNAEIVASSVMAYHTVLKKSVDYYEALRYARIIAKNLTDTVGIKGVDIFPYSIFYVYYEQYLTIWSDMLQSTGFSLVAVLVVSFIFSGFDLFVAIIIAVNCLMVLTSEVAFLYYLGITLNAVSVVNLVITIGISVEFCGHIIFAYKKSTASNPTEKAKEALITMGLKVLCGITITKFVGIIVLAFAKSQIFRIFYFKMYLVMVISGALHSLVFLPAFLSFAGQIFSQ